MTDDLRDYLKAKLMVFTGEGHDPNPESATIVEVTDRGPETEIAFTLKARRFYLRFDTVELLRAIPLKKPRGG